MEKVRVGIIGVGGIAQSKHIPGLKACKEAEIVAVCDINPETLKKVGDDLNIADEYRFEDYQDLIACPLVDAVEICTPNYLHVPMAMDAIRSGKSVNIEKPLALSMEQAMPLTECKLAEDQTVMMSFSYRFMPAIRYAKAMIEEGKLGRITGVEVSYLKDSGLWPGRKLEWRFNQEQAGTGVLGDLGVHLIDMTQLLAGRIVSICGRAQTIITERMKLDDSGMGKVETDDVCSFLAVLENGVDVTFNINRCAHGHKNTIRFEIYGTEGAMSLNLVNPKVISVAWGEEKQLHEIEVPQEYHADQEQSFIDAVLGKELQWYPTLEDGFNSQTILDALYKSSLEKRWVDI